MLKGKAEKASLDEFLIKRRCSALRMGLRIPEGGSGDTKGKEGRSA
jgi:hypothetical protein